MLPVRLSWRSELASVSRPQQDLTLLHALTLFHQDLIYNATDGDLHFFDGADWFKLSRCYNNLFCFGDRYPADAKGGSGPSS